MEDSASELACRHCGRQIAIPASFCPWCGERIMVICATCKQYSPDHLPQCLHCHEPLEADDMQEVRAIVGLHPDVARLAADQARAQLVASGTVGRYTSGFFYDNGERRTALAELFGSPPDPIQTASGLLFAAVAYLVAYGYCDLRGSEYNDDDTPEWLETKKWDGQISCLEGTLATHSGFGLSIQDVLTKTVEDEMGFGFELTKPPRIRTPGMPEVPPVRNISNRHAIASILETARRTDLPDHEESVASATTYRAILSFVQDSPSRAKFLAERIIEVLAWFQLFEQDPVLALGR